MRWRVLRILFLIYVAWAVFALLLVPLSALGIIATNPLAAVLALVLGLPWSVLLTWWIDSSSAFLNFLLLVLALLINAAILRYISRRPRPQPEPEEEDDEDDEFEGDEDPDAELDPDDDWDEPEEPHPPRR